MKKILNWDEYFMGVAKLSAMRSKDPNTKVGACIVNEQNRIVGVGYNGFPYGCNDDEYPWGREGEHFKTKYPYVVHAELNAILNYKGNSLVGAKMYVNQFPCNECAKLIIQSGIKEVIYLCDKYKDTDGVKASKLMFDECGVTYHSLEINKNDSVPAEQPSQHVSSVYSVTFKDYDELSEKFESTLEELITEMNEKYADTAAIENYKKNIQSKHSISVPFSDGNELQLRNKEGFSNISFYSRELYSKPCIFYHFADEKTNSYIKILDVSDEIKNNNVPNACDFMKMMDPDPDDDKFYPSYDSISIENVMINGKSVEVVSGRYDNS